MENEEKLVNPELMPFNELVIRAIKFLLENRDMEFEDMVNGLKSIGWYYWNPMEINRFNLPQPTSNNIFDALKEGNIYTAAQVLLNVMRGRLDYAYVKEIMLSDETNVESLVEFVRKASGDEAYSIENNSKGR